VKSAASHLKGSLCPLERADAGLHGTVGVEESELKRFKPEREPN
jgi:hypothetical protein